MSDETMDEGSGGVQTADLRAADIDGAFVPVPRPQVAGVEIEGETVVVREGTRNVTWLDPVATVVWGCFDGQTSLDQLVGELSAAFGEREEVIREDVLALTRNLGRAGLLEGVAEEIQTHAHERVMPEGLPAGTEIPPFDATELGGAPVAFQDLLGEEILLINWSPRCGFCRRIAGELGELKTDLEARGVQLVLLSFGDAQENRELLETEGLDCTLLLNDGAPELFAGVGTPSAYLVDAEGKIASDLTVGALDVPVLARRAAGRED